MKLNIAPVRFSFFGRTAVLQGLSSLADQEIWFGTNWRLRNGAFIQRDIMHENCLMRSCQ